MADDIANAEERRGRPTLYTKELGDLICQLLSEGRTLRDVCRDEGMPNEATVRGWALRDDTEARPGFFTQYAHAREIGYYAMADETLEISDDGRNDWMTRKQGEDAVEVVNQEAIARSRLRVDTRKWLLSKALPKVFGERVIHAGDADNPVVTKETGFDRESARRLAFALAEAARGSGEGGTEGD